MGKTNTESSKDTLQLRRRGPFGTTEEYAAASSSPTNDDEEEVDEESHDDIPSRPGSCGVSISEAWNETDRGRLPRAGRPSKE
mmetsp:Transcript_34605/g.80008  ORF Transcript_34605/g.80008 Transcript_34605/m.80008 type:complete len:83 (-) Transcript_34605:525-773(-)|eukprot:CAMPEP_0113297052 /NCGR_PEP_ID=MMETSP0010_2-20120614/76_1 /TAXON_ID=216773 ORGANISM="Corethron hystrix, Strain 308" /NCGR_SAMPLE_ID=MMETSP0010_2 /ASSEMBLY_ACC=CAM_ASM_000155 /LENGTH=82 /DNA_ID=CAMNT_0000149879 /DNA_START=642 /DNA_END=890 /DNA_ORIENTATION=- /assembly_acc=CAM_ASM_000155